MQLVAYGAQDIYLTGNPMITYFKVVYRRHTNFAMESIQQTFNGSVGFGNRVSALISRNGDLVSGMILEAKLPPLVNGNRWVQDVGHHLISEVTVEIGGQQIDQHYSDWLEIWAQLTVPAGQKVGYREMIGQSPLAADGGLSGLQITGATDRPGTALSSAGNVVYIPLQFWFCRNVGLSLPLIALQYHEVKVNISFSQANRLSILNAGVPGGLSAALWVDYIYLDTDERRRFAQVSHEYLIEQLQTTGEISVSSAKLSAALNFNHPVKELIWIFKPTHGDGMELSNHSLTLADRQMVLRDNYSGRTAALNAVAADGANAAALAAAVVAGTVTASAPALVDAVLNLNGQQRFAKRVGAYFNLVQTRCHTNVPDSRGIYVYSFALKPEDHQPSGSCNFSRIDNASLDFTLNFPTGAGGSCTVYAVNYNVLRIMSGMGGMAYSN